MTLIDKLFLFSALFFFNSVLTNPVPVVMNALKNNEPELAKRVYATLTKAQKNIANVALKKDFSANLTSWQNDSDVALGGKIADINVNNTTEVDAVKKELQEKLNAIR